MKKTIKLIAVVCAFIFIQNAQAQYFGQNKVRYKKFDFKVVESDHFETYHYLKNDSLIIGFVKDAEKWKKRHGFIFKDSFDYKIPIILYNNHADFQQTSVVGGLIGTSTGGVTEGLKNRVTLPLTPSFAQNDHVLGHELVHAHQYNMIKSGDSLSFNNLGNIPLWMTEGLAEYMSIGNVDEHTAMWMRDAVANDYFPSIKDLYESRYFPYRFGHAFWAFVGGTFGDDRIEPLYKETAFLGVKDAFKRELFMSIDSFSARWKATTENFYKPLIKDRKLQGIGNLLINDKNGGRLNVSPAISPDGKYFIFYSEKNLFSLDLFLADAKTGKIIKKLTTRARDSHLDDIDGFESAGTWSPDSRKYAFISFSQGRKKLIMADVVKNTVVEEFFIKDIPAFDNLDWSPDGKKILFTALINGQSDLYYIDVQSKEVTQLTDDYFAQIHGKWSPDGSKILFVSDKLDRESARPSKFMSIFEMNVNDKSIRQLPLFENSHNLNPVYSGDGESVYFLSDREGFRDLYQYDFTSGTILQLTRFVTGISGITHYAPAISISKTDDILYNLYNNSNYIIYRVSRNEIIDLKEVAVTDVDQTAAKLPSMNLQESFVDRLLDNENIVTQAGKMTQEPYKPKFKLDYISNGGLGVSTGRYGTGMAGGVNMLFGDMLNHSQLYVGAVLNGEISDFGAQVAYLNSKSRFGWGGSLSHIPYSYYYDGYDNQSYIYYLYKYTMFQEQASFFTYYPFSKVRRLELSSSTSYYSFNLNIYPIDLYYGYYLDPIRNQDAGDPFFIQDFNMAYVGDNSSFGLTSPMNGYRYRFEVQQSLGEVKMTSVLADARKYFYIKPFGLAVRGMSFNRLGDGAVNTIFPPLYIGYETIVRGYTQNAMEEAKIYNGSTLDYTDLMGSRMMVGSAEIRFPLTGPERLAAIKSGMFFTDLNLFFDAGVAWGKYYSYSDGLIYNRDLSNSTVITSTGLSLRVNLFGQLIIEPYVAKPMQIKGSKPVFGINFIPGW